MITIEIISTAETNHDSPEDLHGQECDTRFWDYLPHNLKNIVSEGYMDFRWGTLPEDDEEQLLVYTVYKSPKRLNDAEMLELVQETQGQWSDGIGESFEQTPVYDSDGIEAYISAYHRGQVIHTRQIGEEIKPQQKED